MENQATVNNEVNYDSEEFIPKGDIVQHHDKAVDIVVCAKDVGISEEEAKQFHISVLNTQFKKVMSTIQRIIAEILGMDFTVKVLHNR